MILSTQGLSSRIMAVFLVLGLNGLVFSVQAKEIKLPAYGADKHLGIKTCSGSTCHGATRPLKGSPVLQNEFFTWKRKDQHSKAYRHLKNDQSRQIAKNLRLKKPAHQSKICLDCHADNVPRHKQGKRFQISDGVSCESCHGGAKRWIGSHISGEDSHQSNIDHGLFPTEDPVQRARLCLSCHFGNHEKFATHEIMGAGHPRISFELDTYTTTQPKHYKIDKDYFKRKTVADGTQIWVIGQAVAVGLFLDKISTESNLVTAGLFPELSLFDCQSCHHAMKKVQWTGHTGLKPGVVRLNDGHFVLLRHAIKTLHPDWDQKYSAGLHQLHQATTQGKKATIEAAESLRRMTRSLVDEFAKHRFSDAEKKGLLLSIIAEGVAGRHADYIVAEQSLMALDAISRSLSDKTERATLIKKINPLYNLFGDNPKMPDTDNARYDRDAYKNGLSKIQAGL